MWMELGGYRVPVVNATGNTSDLGHRLCEMFPAAAFSASYRDAGVLTAEDRRREWSLRSVGDFDVSAGCSGASRHGVSGRAYTVVGRQALRRRRTSERRRFSNRAAALTRRDSGRATLGSLLKAEGYRTAAIGKWHLGLGGIRQNGALQETVTDGPHTHGFDESYIIPASVANPPYVYIRDGRVTGFPLGRQAALSFPRFIRAGEKGSNFDPAGVLDELIGEVVEFIEQQAAGVGAVARFATTTATRRRKRRASCSAPPGPPRRRATSTPRTMWIILRSRCRRPGCWRLRRAGPPIRSARCGSGALVARADGGGERQNFRLRTPVTAAPVMVAVAGQGGTTGAYTLETRLLTGYLENPGPASFQSGIGVISGWTCDAEMVEIALNRVPQEAAYGTERLDTEPVCGDVDNGFGLLFNWNRLGDGEHEVVALVDGVELGRATVQVTTVGAGAEQEFLREAEGECSVEDFPMGGQTTTLVWQQSSQNFVIADVE